MCACMYLLVAELLHLGIGLRVDLLEHRGARLQGDARVCEACIRACAGACKCVRMCAGVKGF